AALADAVWPRIGRPLKSLTRSSMTSKRLRESAYKQHRGDYVLRILDGKHAEVFQIADTTHSARLKSQLFPDIWGSEPSQRGSWFFADTENPEALRFRGKDKLFAHLQKHPRLLIQLNLSMSIARAALYVRRARER